MATPRDMRYAVPASRGVKAGTFVGGKLAGAPALEALLPEGSFDVGISAVAGDVVLSDVVAAGALRGESVPAWLEGRPLWEWFEIPGTALSSVPPSPVPVGYNGPRSKIDCWCGATLKRDGSVYILGAAGGHQDYSGNEVNSIELNVDAPAWIERRGPTPNAYVIDNTQYFLQEPDGRYRPNPTHTYSATQFIDSMNKMLIMPSAGVYSTDLFPPAPVGFPYTGVTRIHSFDLATDDWDGPDHLSQYPGGGLDYYGCLSVKHPVTEDIYYSWNSGDGFYRYRPSSDTWTKLSNVTRAPWYVGSAIDPIRNRILTVGGYSATAPSVLNLTGATVPASFNGPNVADLTFGPYSGVVWDEANENFLVFYNDAGGISTRRVHPTTWYVDNPVTGTLPATRTAGIHNSVQYVPELKGVVIANDYFGNMKFMRTST